MLNSCQMDCACLNARVVEGYEGCHLTASEVLSKCTLGAEIHCLLIIDLRLKRVLPWTHQKYALKANIGKVDSVLLWDHTQYQHLH